MPSVFFAQKSDYAEKTLAIFAVFGKEKKKRGHCMPELTFKPARPEDMGTLLSLIKELAEYENLGHEVTATEAILTEWLFEKKKAEVIFPVLEGKAIGYILYFYNFSTFLGKAGIYVEDLFIQPAHRHKGYGKQLLRRLVQKAHAEGLGRVEWACLDWNRPSIDFYLSLGAVCMEGWSAYRLTGDSLAAFAEGRE